MPEGDPTKILLAHDRWATGRLLDACAALSDEEFHRRFDIGNGSLHDALTHVLGATRTWTGTLAGTAGGPGLGAEPVRRTPAELRALFDEAYAAFAAEAGRRPLDEVVTRRMRDGRSLELTRGAIVAHVTTHAMHHRAQCLNMLRRLGVAALPPSSVAEWTWLGDSQG